MTGAAYAALLSRVPKVGSRVAPGDGQGMSLLSRSLAKTAKNASSLDW